MSELKPCPFCGAERGFYVLWEEETPYVFCDNCKTSVSNERSNTEQEAIAAWNTRAERIVHCRDCEYRYYESKCVRFVRDNGVIFYASKVEPDGFCAWAKPKVVW